jgi:hypothetical protein
MVFMITICTIHAQFCNYLISQSYIPYSYSLCGRNNILCVSGRKIPFSHVSVNSLLCCKMSCFIPVMAMCRNDWSVNQNIIVKKLSIVGVYKLLVNFNSFSYYTSTSFFGSCFIFFNCKYSYSSFYIVR